jgi:NADH-quinone oxidoreductase subunit K
MLTNEIYILWSSQLFIVGFFGVLSSQNNVLFMLMAIEISLLAINAIFIIFSSMYNDINGLLFSLFILAVAAAESTIGLALLVLFFKIRGTIAYPFINLIKG